MPRSVLFIVGLLLVLAPIWLLFGFTVPVKRYRTGSFEDYAGLLRACITLYAGSAFGLVMLWLRGEPWRRSHIIVVAAVGAVIGALIAIVRSGAGTLWGLVVIFAFVLGGVVGVGVSCMWRLPRPNNRSLRL